MRIAVKYITLVFAGLLLANACSVASTAVRSSPETVLVGSTPGGAEIKQILGIDSNKQLDFIRWELRLSQRPAAFRVNITFGEGQPNTRGFKGGGESLEFSGTYTAANRIYKLSGEKLSAPLFLSDLDDRVFHFITQENKLMAGNGGWSYTLTRRDGGVAGAKRELITRSKLLMNDVGAEMVFDGRTPCVDLGKRELPYAEGCLKLKWRLRLNRDPRSKTTGTYVLESTLNRRQAAEGRWAFVNGTHTNPNALIIRLDPERPNEAVSFLVGDENVLFFLDKDERLLAGNEDFGFTLNRRLEAGPVAAQPR